jgi:uncharacterized protein
MTHPVNWFAITGPNGKTLQSFYSKVFDWALKPLDGGGDMQMVAPVQDGIAGGIGTSQNKQPSVAVYVSVGDVNAYLAKADRAGGKMAMPKTPLPNDMGSIAGFTDPAGNWIGLWEPSKKVEPAPAPKKAAKEPAQAASSKKKASAKKKKKASSGGAKKKAAPAAKKKAGATKKKAGAQKK